MSSVNVEAREEVRPSHEESTNWNMVILQRSIANLKHNQNILRRWCIVNTVGVCVALLIIRLLT